MERVAGGFGVLHVRFDSGIKYRLHPDCVVFADYHARCPDCGAWCLVVDNQRVTRTRYDLRWIAQTMAQHKIILGLPEE